MQSFNVLSLRLIHALCAEIGVKIDDIVDKDTINRIYVLLHFITTRVPTVEPSDVCLYYNKTTLVTHKSVVVNGQSISLPVSLGELLDTIPSLVLEAIALCARERIHALVTVLDIAKTLLSVEEEAS